MELTDTDRRRLLTDMVRVERLDQRRSLGGSCTTQPR
jgi:hypothetical protein